MSVGCSDAVCNLILIIEWSLLPIGASVWSRLTRMSSLVRTRSRVEGISVPLFLVGCVICWVKTMSLNVFITLNSLLS